MSACPYCKEDVREGALKCPHCQSSLLPLPAAPGGDHADRRTTYVLDTDLVRFAKFAAAVLAVFLVVGATLFGFKLESSVEKVSSLQAQARETAAELQKAQQELTAAKAAVVTLKAEVEGVLAQANRTLSEIGTQRDTAIAMVSSIRVLSPQQSQALAALPSAEAERTRRGSKLWAVGATIRVGFLGGSPSQRRKVQDIAAEWTRHARLDFRFVASGESDVRIGFDPAGGSWSFVGTDALAVDRREPTMNLAWIERDNVLHEFGHVLGLIEEHQNPGADIRWDRAAVLRTLQGAPNFWSPEQVEEKVFRPVPRSQVGDYRPFDPRSIMSFTFPPDMTGGLALGSEGGLSDSDKALVRRLYPGR
jgi:hypothetical protein